MTQDDAHRCLSEWQDSEDLGGKDAELAYFIEPLTSFLIFINGQYKDTNNER